MLDDIPGIGPARRKALMRRFQDIDSVRNATVEMLEATPQMNRRAAESVYDFFHKGAPAGPENSSTGPAASGPAEKTHDNTVKL